MNLVLAYAVIVWALVEWLRMRDAADWQEVEDTLWKMEMREKYPWPLFRM